jgi:hypothetical protein
MSTSRSAHNVTTISDEGISDESYSEIGERRSSTGTLTDDRRCIRVVVMIRVSYAVLFGVIVDTVFYCYGIKRVIIRQ